MQPSRNDGNGSAGSHGTPEDNDLTSPANLRKLVLNYLIHHCYTETAVAFAKDGITGDLLNSDGSSASAGPSASSSSKGKLNGGVSRPNSDASSAARLSASTGHGNGRQAHPLSAPPLSRDDSSMEVEVESLLPTSSEHANDYDGSTDPSIASGRTRRTAGNAFDRVVPSPSASNGHGYSNGSSLHQNGAGHAITVDDGDEDLKDLEDDQEHAPGEQDQEESDVSPDLTAEDLRAVCARKQIREHIIAGRVRQAMDMCNAHFPTVLNAHLNGNSKTAQVKHKGSNPSHDVADRVLPANPTSLEPDHLLLNLQIQVFIEAIRSASAAQLSPGAGLGASPQLGSSGYLPSLASTTPGIAAAAISRSASPAPSSSSSTGSATSATGGNAALNPALHSALAYAQGLYTSAQRLPSYWRAMYLKELEQVTALLAYTDVEHSPVRRFLHRSRKVALAEQVNSAILFRSGKPSQPLIESAVRQTNFLWTHLHQEKVQVPSNHPIFSLVSPAGGSGSAYEDSSSKKHANSKTVPAWDFRTFLAER